MKKAADVRYPNSASLFQFCRRVLDHKFGGVRVIDQDVGQILGFDPADCSHWKKGKKNIRSIQAMKSIAEHLGVDEKLVVDVASGDLEESEAFFEYTGYGAVGLDTKLLEAAKKDYYRKYAGSWTKDRETEFKEAFNANEPVIDRVVAEIHARLNFQEAPLYLPEIGAAYTELTLMPIEGREISAGASAVTAQTNGKQLTISYSAGSEMRPYMRYRIARAMAPYFLNDALGKPEEVGNEEFGAHLSDVRSNLFAAKLLAPAPLIRREMANVNVSRDVVTQLSETFWVSKIFMNRRLKEILQNHASL